MVLNAFYWYQIFALDSAVESACNYIDVFILDEEAPFEPRDVKIRSGCWITEEYDVLDVLLGRYVCCAQNVIISNCHWQLSM